MKIKWFKKPEPIPEPEPSLLDQCPEIVLWEPRDTLLIPGRRRVSFVGITNDEQIVFREQDGTIDYAKFNGRLVQDPAYGFFSTRGIAFLNETFKTRHLLNGVDSSRIMAQIKEIRKQLDPMIEISEFDSEQKQ